MKFQLTLLLPVLGLAAPASASPTTTTISTRAPACVYSSLPSATAFAALMPNSNLTPSKIQNYFENFSFACKPGSHFSAKQLALSDKPWFGGDVQSSTQCTPPSFANLVDFAMQDGNQGTQYNVQCVQYKGETSDAFHKAAGQYFASLK